MAGSAAVALSVSPLSAASGPAKTLRNRIRIGACDWSLGHEADVEAFDIAQAIGLDGVQVSLGTGGQMRLCEEPARKATLQKSAATGVKVASLAIGDLNRFPYKSDPKTIPWVECSIEACQALGVNVVLLAFFANNDLCDDPAGIKEVVTRLKAVAPRAEKAGVSLGIESWLNAGQLRDILDRIGSPAVKVYYDVCNTTERGYDIGKEIRMLGKGRICEFHAKENGALLGKGKVDYNKMRDALEDIGYEGWVQIEGAVPRGADRVASYKANCEFLRKTFGLA